MFIILLFACENGNPISRMEEYNGMEIQSVGWKWSRTTIAMDGPYGLPYLLAFRVEVPSTIESELVHFK